MQHAARYHILGFSNQNPAFARKMSEKLEEILQRFKDDWDALEAELDSESQSYVAFRIEHGRGGKV